MQLLARLTNNMLILCSFLIVAMRRHSHTLQDFIQKEIFGGEVGVVVSHTESPPPPKLSIDITNLTFAFGCH